MAHDPVYAGVLSRVEPAGVPRALVAAQARRLAGFVFVVAIVLSPFRAGLVLASRPQPPIQDAYTDFTLPVGEIALLATLALWAIALVAQPRHVSLGPRFLRWPIAGILALTWLGVPFSIDPALSAYNAVQLAVFAALALYALNEIDSLAALAVPLAAMIAIQAIAGLGQLVAQRSLGLQSLGELALDPARNGISVVAASGAGRLLRAYGLADHPNILGGVLACALPLVAIGRSRVGDTRPLRALVVTLAIAGLFATFSRAAWLAAAAGLATAVAILAVRGSGRRGLHIALRRSGPVVAVGAAVAIALVVAYVGYVGVRTGSSSAPSVTEEMSLGERSILATDAVRIAAAHPLFGTGLGTLPLAIHAADPGLTFASQPAHVVLLDVAAETGILAALLYAGVLVAPWLAAWRERRRWTTELAAASGALASITLVGFLDHYTWTFATGRFWAWLVLALWAGAYARSLTRGSGVAAQLAATSRSGSRAGGQRIRHDGRRGARSSG